MTEIKTVKPKIYIVGSQVFHDSEMNKFLTDHFGEEGGREWLDGQGDAQQSEILVESAGRLCYMSFGKPRPGGNKEYIHHIKEMAHGSVLEHAVWNFIITGVSRTFSHELVRHRAGFGYSQLSQRYVDESVAEYVLPDIINEFEETKEIWMKSIQQSHEAYIKLADALYYRITSAAHKRFLGPLPKQSYNDWLRTLSPPERTQFRKEARQAARSVLPNACETKLFFTANARALRHFIELRAHPAAEVEIRTVALMLLNVMQIEAPNIFGDYQEDGGQVFTPFRKV